MVLQEEILADLFFFQIVLPTFLSITMEYNKANTAHNHTFLILMFALYIKNMTAIQLQTPLKWLPKSSHFHWYITVI